MIIATVRVMVQTADGTWLWTWSSVEQTVGMYSQKPFFSVVILGLTCFTNFHSHHRGVSCLIAGSVHSAGSFPADPRASPIARKQSQIIRGAWVYGDDFNYYQFYEQVISKSHPGYLIWWKSCHSLERCSCSNRRWCCIQWEKSRWSGIRYCCPPELWEAKKTAPAKGKDYSNWKVSVRWGFGLNLRLRNRS